jgi:hypothetical protein
MAQEQDILNHPTPKQPPRLTSRRIGIHTSTAGGVQNAADRAYRLGCNTFQIFSSSPRQWAPYELAESQCAGMSRLRAEYDLKPLVIHCNYLINLASSTELFLQKSMQAFRGEVMRALSLCAEYLVLHPALFAVRIASKACCVQPPPLQRQPRAGSGGGWTDHPDREYCGLRVLPWRNIRASCRNLRTPKRNHSRRCLHRYLPYARGWI